MYLVIYSYKKEISPIYSISIQSRREGEFPRGYLINIATFNLYIIKIDIK